MGRFASNIPTPMGPWVFNGVWKTVREPNILSYTILSLYVTYSEYVPEGWLSATSTQYRKSSTGYAGTWHIKKTNAYKYRSR
jgi:hypothetical protein